MILSSLGCNVFAITYTRENILRGAFVGGGTVRLLDLIIVGVGESLLGCGVGIASILASTSTFLVHLMQPQQQSQSEHLILYIYLTVTPTIAITKPPTPVQNIASFNSDEPILQLLRLFL
jgi:hypothetical protein